MPHHIQVDNEMAFYGSPIQSSFPTLSLRIFPHVLGPLLRLLLLCSYPFLPTRQRPSYRYELVSAIAFEIMAFPRTEIQYGITFETVVIR